MAEPKTKQYRIELPYYRQGVLYPPGSIVTIPADEKPSKTWTAVEEAAPAKGAVTEQPKDPKAPKRASDKDAI